MDQQAYAFDNALPSQRERLRTLEALLDAGTIRLLEARGPQPDWRCLEVGAGGGSIAAWLSARVGSVLATDIDITHLREVSHANLEVRVHDIIDDDLPQGAFDLIHLRLVLAWLADRDVALRRLRAALKPGGWLVAEEMDFVSAVGDPRMGEHACALFERIVAAHNTVLVRDSGFDPAYGRRVAGDLAAAGFTEVGCEGRVAMWTQGPGARIWQHTIGQLREAMVAGGLAPAEEIDETLALLGSERFRALSPIVMGVWGRAG